MADVPQKIQTSTLIVEHAGRWLLARVPEQITLADAYLALGESIVANSGDSAPPLCSIDHALHSKVCNIMEDASKGEASAALSPSDITTVTTC